MADKKKLDEGGGGSFMSVWVVIGIVAVLVIVLGFSKTFSPTYINIESFFRGIFSGVGGIVSFFTNGGWGWIKVFSALLSTLLIALNIFLIIKLLEMEREHADHAYHDTDHEGHGSRNHDSGPMQMLGKMTDLFDTNQTQEKLGLAKWEIVTDYISSQNDSDWRLAIIEADNLLDSVIEGRGYPGATLGERLKNAGVGAFQTYQDAWDAHRMRNSIAHEGLDFKITYRDAKRVIAQYENVFREFGYI